MPTGGGRRPRPRHLGAARAGRFVRRVSLALAASLLACGESGGPAPWLEDVTDRGGIDVVHETPDGYASLVDRLGGGVCVLDADGALPMDLFFAARAGGSRLMTAASPLAFVDASGALPGLGGLDAIGCLALDADDDGDDDLLVTGVGVLALYLREGTAFRDATSELAVTVPARHVLTSAAAGDVDRDGRTDVIVAGLSDVSMLDPGDCGGVPCAVLVGRHPPIPNLFLRGEGGGHFALDAIAGGPLSVPEPTLVVAVVDLDGDGAIDVYVGNDAGDEVRDRALVWDGTALVDASDRIGLAYDSRGHGIDTMGFAAGDVDGDLDLDFAVTAFEGFPSPVFVCQDGVCEDRGRALGMLAAVDSFRWGNALVDLDLDGRLDLVELAGHVYTESEGRALGFPLAEAQPLNLFAGTVSGFARIAPDDSGGATLLPLLGRGLAVTDLDEDGRPDLVVTQSRGPARLLRNARPSVGRPLVVSLPRRAASARVIVRSGDFAAVRVRASGEGFLGSFDPRLFFAVPGDGPIEVTVERPGAIETYDLPGSERGLVVE
jgi:hypothetical protein